jgi:hypothetical protein
MNKKRIGVVFCMLMLLPLLMTCVSASPTVDIKVKGGLRSWTAIITNTGDEPLTNTTDVVQWGFARKFIPFKQPSLPAEPISLAPGESTSFSFGFGSNRPTLVNIDVISVKVTRHDVSIADKTVTALRLFNGFIILSK